LVVAVEGREEVPNHIVPICASGRGNQLTQNLGRVFRYFAKSLIKLIFLVNLCRIGTNVCDRL